MWQEKFFTYGIIILLFFSVFTSGSVDLWAQTLVHLGTILLALFYFLISFQRKEIVFSSIPPILTIFLFSLCLSYCFSYSKFTSREEFLNWLNYLVFFLFASIFSKEKKLFCQGIVCLALLLTLNGIFEYFFRGEYPLKSSLINPNIFAGYLIMVIPLTINQIIDVKPGIRESRWYFLVGSILIIGLILTGSWGAILSLLIALALFSRQLSIFKKVPALFLIPIIIVIALFILKFFQPGTCNRLNWWQGAAEMFLTRPLTGIGLGNFARYYPQFKMGGLNSLYAHNHYLQMLAESGIFSLVLFIGVLIYFFREREKNLGICMGITALLVHNFIDYNLAIPGVALTFWTLLGLEINPAPIRFRVNLKGKRYFLAVPTILLLFFSYFVVKIFLANRAYARGLYYFNSENNLPMAEEELSYSLKLDRDYTPTYQVLSGVYTSCFIQGQSTDYLRRALNLTEQAIKKEKKYAPYWLDKTWISYLLGEKEIARKTLQEAKKLKIPTYLTTNLEKMLK